MFKCPVCNITATTYGNYKSHISTKKHKTTLIEKQKNPITPSSSIYDIQNTESNNNSEFICKCCNKAFFSKFSLERHGKSCKELKKLLSTRKINIVNNLDLSSLDITSIENGNQIIIVVNPEVGNTNYLQQINLSNSTINSSNVITNNITNNIVNNIPADDIIDTKIKKAVDKIIYDSCKDPGLYVDFDTHWKKQKVLPLGYETDEHITNHIEIWSSGRKSFMVYLESLFSNPVNQNIYATEDRKKTAKYIAATGQVKEMNIQKLMEIETLNNIDRYNNYVKRTSGLVEPRYKKVVEQMQKEQEASEDTIPNFDGFLTETWSVVKDYSKAAKKNIKDYEKNNPAIIHGPVISTKALPSTEMRVNF